MINKLIKYLPLILLCFSSNYIFSQDLKTTEIRVVEGLDVSVPDANKLNVKAFFMDTTKIDKTQNCLAAYNKKKEFDGGEINIENLECLNYEKKLIIDELSLVKIKNLKLNEL